MKILALNTFAGSGSTGRIALDIAQYAAGQGSETIIGFGAGDVPLEAQQFALRIGGRAGRKWHGALRKLLDGEGYGSLAATLRLISFLKVYRPDVVHLHNLHGCYLNHRLLFRALRASGVPVLWTLHDCWPFTGHCAYFDFIGCDRWQTACHHCPQLRGYPTCIGADGSARNYRRRRKLFTDVPNMTLAVPCRWMGELVSHSFLANHPVRVVYNGVNRDVFRPIPSDIRQKHGITEPYVALAVASEWEERKGVRHLPEIAASLGGEYRLVVLGLSKAQIEALPNGVLGLPRTASPRELVAWYTAADCFVNPTLEDNMPLVNLEAMACGTPVAVFATGGCPECIAKGCGIVAPRGDVPALVQAVQQLAPQKATMREACLAQAAAFDAMETAKNYFTLYGELCR